MNNLESWIRRWLLQLWPADLFKTTNRKKNHYRAHSESDIQPDEYYIAQERINTVRQSHSAELLDLEGLHLTKLPASLGSLHRLKELLLDNNLLQDLPGSMRHLNNLRVVSIRSNKFIRLPDVLRSMSTLERLYLDDNELAELPFWIKELVSLQELSVNRNRLHSLASSIGNLDQLEVLLAQNNRLKTLPLSLTALKRLRVLSLIGNPDLGIPVELLGREHEAEPQTLPSDILDFYFRTRVDGAQPLNEARLILVGRGEVGKTALVARLIRDEFVPQRKTEGIQITDWSVQLHNCDVRLHVWDFGGQEIMHATHQFFLTERSLYLLVLNGREGGEDADVEYWLKLIESFGGNSPVIIVLNKISSHPFELNRRGLQQKYGDRIRAFVRTDCEDSTGVAELRKVIKHEIDRLPNLRDKFPNSWFSIKQHLERLNENYISFDQYRDVCAAYGETQEEAQELLGRALHCLGVALNYKDDSRLQDLHVLNPHWVTNGIYKLLNAATVQKQCGEISLSDIRGILDPRQYPSTMHEFLLNLMRKFELCFRFPEPRDDTYLSPQLLSKEQPDIGPEFAPSECLTFLYDYPVWPEGLLPRFIVRTRSLSDHLYRWRTGVVLEFETNRALVLADPQEKRVYIYVNGPPVGRPRLLAVIRSDFERIHADIPQLKPIAKVPLNDSASVALSYDELQAYESKKVPSITRLIDGQLTAVDVRQVLENIELPMRQRYEVAVFISYSHKDEELRAELETRLKIFQRQGLIKEWSDRRIAGGIQWRGEITRNLERANLILLLISDDFIASDYCYDVEMTRALELNAAGRTRVVPIILRECSWRMTQLVELQVFPRKGKPITSWKNRDKAWQNVATGLEEIVTELRGRIR